MNVKHAVNVGSILFVTLLNVSLSLQACAQTDEDGLDDPYANATQPMTAIRMGELIPIEGTDNLSKDELLRLMQANFDSALDARYAIAQALPGRVAETIHLRRSRFFRKRSQLLSRRAPALDAEGECPPRGPCRSGQAWQGSTPLCLVRR